LNFIQTMISVHSEPSVPNPFNGCKIGNKMGDMNAQLMLETLVESFIDNSTERKEIYRIGDLAREFDVSLRTLRFYEDRGLISPQRSGSTRLYSNEDRKRLKIIILAKNVGFSLIEIEALLKVYDDDSNEQDVTYLVDKFKEQFSRLNNQKEELQRSIDELSKAISFIEDNSQ